MREEARKKRKQAQEQSRRKRLESTDPADVEREDQDKYDEFNSFVVSELMNFKETIDLSHFGRDYNWDADKIRDAFDDFLWNSPEIFFVSRCHHYSWSSDLHGSVTKFYVNNILYGIRKEEYEDGCDKLEAEVSKALLLLKGITDPVKKALLLHDYIVDVCEYDVEAADQHDTSPLARTAYSVLVRHKAVCEGYVMGYRYLLNRAGIKSEEIISDKMHHCWSYLYLNGHWYHVDVTWDDPVFVGGKKPDHLPISHDNFLMSDAKARRTKHRDWSTRGLSAANDNSFDEQDWSKY